MNINNNSKNSWRLWLVKKLLTKQTNKDDVLRILSDNSNRTPPYNF